MKRTLGLLLLLTLFFMVGCSSEKEESEIYTSFYPVYTMVKEIAGDEVKVASFMPLDKSAHFWSPSAKDMKKLAHAKVLYVNGAGMEPWLPKVKETLPDLKIVTLSDYISKKSASGKALHQKVYHVVKLSLKKDETYTFDFGHTHEKNLDVMFFKGDDPKNLNDMVLEKDTDDTNHVEQKAIFLAEDKHHYVLEMGHYEGQIQFKVPSTETWTMVVSMLPGEKLPYKLSGGNGALSMDAISEINTKKKVADGVDPHTFLSVNHAIDYARAINESLAELYPEKSRTFEDNEKLMVRGLAKLKRDYASKFLTLSNKTFLVTHGAFGYLADEFGLKQVAIQAQNTEDRPSLKAIKESIELAKNEHITTIFYERGGDKKGADIVAAEFGGESMPLDTMEYLPKGEDLVHITYEALLKNNLEALYQALKGDTNDRDK